MLFINGMVVKMEYKLNDIVEMKKPHPCKNLINGKLLEWVQILKLNVWVVEQL